MWLSATVTVKRPKKYATKLWTKLATNFKLVRWGKTNRKRRREKYECKKSCSRPHTHRHTQPHTATHRHIHMQMVLLPLCVVVVFPLFSPRLFLFASFGYATVYWYYYGTMLCNICKFLLLLPTTVFPEFPQLAQPPPCHQHQATLYPICPHCCPILTVLTFVGIIPHIVAAGVFVLFAFCSGSSSLLLLYNL